MQKIKLTDIEGDLTLQPRAGMTQTYVDELVEVITSGVTLPPITVFSDNGKSGPFRLADGFHRYAATSQLALKTIDADVLTGTAHHAFKYSLGANVEHGMRRTNADKRRAVLLACSDSILSQMSDAKIAEVCFVSAPFVADARAKKAADDKEPMPATLVGKDGKNHPASKKDKKEKDSASEADEPTKSQAAIFDAAGFEVPKEREDLFNQSQETQKRLLSLVSEVRSALRLRPNSFAFVSSEAFELAEALYAELKPIALEHVCPKCHGKKCAVCHQLGLMPKSFYASSVSQKDKP